MSKIDPRNALLIGSYISSLTPWSFVPEVVTPDISMAEVTSAVDKLIADGLIVQQPGLLPMITGDHFTCPFDITEKGKGLLGFGAGLQKADFSIFKIIVATGGSTVTNVEQKTQTITVQNFEQNMLKQIETSNFTTQQKEEAKSKLQEFLKHPLLGTLLGAALGAVLKT